VLPPLHVRFIVCPGDIVDGTPFSAGATLVAAIAPDSMLANMANGKVGNLILSIELKTDARLQTKDSSGFQLDIMYYGLVYIN
jgi:hypothetical protein